MPKAQSRALPIAFVTVLLDLVGFGIIIPIQPFYAESFGATAIQVTLLGTAYSGMQFLFSPFWGRLSDKIGRRPVMLTSISIGVIGYVIFALSPSLAVLFAARMLSGLGTANISTAHAIVADVTDASSRSRGMGLIGMAFGIGFILGPALGGALGQISGSAPAWAAAGLGLANLIWAWRMLPETLPAERRRATKRRASGRFSGWRTAVSFPNVRRLVFINLVLITGMALMEQTLALFVEHHWVTPLLGIALELDPLAEASALTAWVLITVGVTAAYVQGRLIGPLVKRFGEQRLIRTGALITAASFALIPVAGIVGEYWLLLPIGVLMAVGTSIMSPSINGLLSRSVDSDVQGLSLGLAQSFSALGRTVGPAIAGVLFTTQVGLPFLTAAALLIVVFLIGWGLREPSV